jgi:hypothetical protein
VPITKQMRCASSEPTEIPGALKETPTSPGR